MHAYGMEERKNQLWIPEAWKTTSEEWSKRMGVKEGRKLAEDRIFISYFIPLSILPQKKVSHEHKCLSKFSKEATLTECDRVLAPL